MIKILRASAIRDRVVRLEFSDGASGILDLAPLIARNTTLTRPLADDAYFRRFFIELGALAWPNGLELAPAALHRQLAESGKLEPPQHVA